MSFVSDFSLFPIKKYGKPGWEYRKATWPKEIDQEVHKLFDKKSDEPVFYTRTTIHDNRVQYCKVSRHDDKIMVEPGDGYNFIVRKDNNRNKEEEIDDSVIPHNMTCVICLTHKRTHAVPKCGHVSMCAICAKKQYETNKECPICRTEIDDMPIKLFFA